MMSEITSGDTPTDTSLVGASAAPKPSTGGEAGEDAQHLQLARAREPLRC